MSDMAKQARAAMKAKAKSLTTADPHSKVDSSTWTPAEPLNTEVKTGLRPISRRAFKSGGKVQGAKAKANLGKATRGGNKPITPNNFANKDVKAANEDRAGLKHTGGLKKGGRACKQVGGLSIADIIERDKSVPSTKPGPLTRAEAGIKPGTTNKAANAAAFDKEQQEYQRSLPQNRKTGGRAKKMLGGPLMSPNGMMAPVAVGTPQGAPGGGQTNLPQNVDPGDARFRMVSPQTFNFGSGASGSPYKKGGAVKHDDEAMDIALIKKMVKPAARTKRKEGGGVFSGTSYPGKIPGVVPGGREARAMGGNLKAKGKGKGKTNINIIVAAGQKPGMGMTPPGGPTPPPGMDQAAGAAPIPMPAQNPAAAPMPMPMPIPIPMGGMGGGGGGSPAPRKSGGRITKVASSYKDMEAGAGGGEGRLQKTDIAKKGKDAPAFKRGGRTYRSYKDMDAGAGSGLGRLEKTEIQARKG